MPRVSVIVAAYNSASSIGETLRSVQAQTYRDWEVVVGDDASTDDTVEVARSFDGVRVVQAERNRGHAAPTRNLAARNARGDLLAFLDADDRWSERYLERLVGAYDEAVARGGRVGVVACDAQLASERAPRDARTYYDAVGRPAGSVDVSALLRGNCLYASALVDRASFDAVGGMDEDLRGTDDHDLWLRLAEAGYELLVVDEPLAVYRLRDDQISADERAMARASAEVYARALRRGRLDRAQRRLAWRKLAIQRALHLVPGLAARVPKSRSRFGLAA